MTKTKQPTPTEKILTELETHQWHPDRPFGNFAAAVGTSEHKTRCILRSLADRGIISSLKTGGYELNLVNSLLRQQIYARAITQNWKLPWALRAIGESVKLSDGSIRAELDRQVKEGKLEKYLVCEGKRNKYGYRRPI